MLLREVNQQLPDFSDALGIQAIGGFIENEQLGLRQQRLCQAQPLPHAVRVNSHFVILTARQVHPTQHLAVSMRRNVTCQAGEDPQIFKSGEIVVESGRVNNRSHLAQGLFSMLRNFVSEERDLAGGLASPTPVASELSCFFQRHSGPGTRRHRPAEPEAKADRRPCGCRRSW